MTPLIPAHARFLALLLLGLIAAELRAQESGGRGPETWVITIGIDGYTSFPRCKGAVYDARAVGRALVQAGWGDDHVLFLNDHGDRKPGNATEAARPLLPTRANLDWAMDQWLARRLKPDDVAVLYFAGHAIALPPRADAPPGTRPRDYLLPIDARPEDLDGTGWLPVAALDRLAASSRNAFLFWLDTSTQGRGQRVTDAMELWPSGGRLLDALARWPNVGVWLAAERAVAAEGSAPGHLSPFAAGLLGALGTRVRPSSLGGALHAMRANRAVMRQGFVARGGVAPGLSLWPGQMKRPARPVRALVVQRGHADRICGLAATADGREIVTASMDATLRVWKAADRSLYQVRAGLARRGIRSLALSPDGRWAVTGDGAGQVHVWDRVDQVSRHTAGAPPHAGSVEVVALLPGSQRFVSLDARQGKLLFWDVTDPAPRPRSLIEAGTMGLACASGAVPEAAAEAGAAPPALAASCSDGRIRLFRADGSAFAVQEGLDEPSTALDLSADGWTLAIGGEKGSVVFREAVTGRVIARRRLEGTIDAVHWADSNHVAVSTGEAVVLVPLAEELAVERHAVEGGVGALVCSADGAYLAATSATAGGRVHLWQIHGEKAPAMERVPLGGEGQSAPGGPRNATAVVVAFAPDATSVMAGDAEGGLRAWSLPEGSPRFDLAPNRRKVAALSVADDGAHLLQISGEGVAQVWDLTRGRGVRTLAGRWTSGALLPDHTTVVLTEDADRGGGVVLVDHGSGAVRPVTFERPAAAGSNLPAATVFDRVVAAPGGRTIAAGSSPGNRALVCVWDVTTGALVHTIRDESALTRTALDLARDGRHLLVGFDEALKVWDLAAVERPPPIVRSFRADAPVETAALGPAATVAVGTRAGRVLLARGGHGLQTLPGDPFDGPVKAVAFTPDGRFLGAAGGGGRLAVWALETQVKPVPLAPAPQHDGPINALVAWPGSRLIVTGSDDTTIRFWSLDEARLIGTFAALTPSAATSAASAAGPAPADWVVFTPDGLFDSSPRGGDAVRWAYDGEVRALEQYERQAFYRLRLGEELRRGRAVAAGTLPDQPPPALTLELDAARRRADREALLTITLREPELSDVRLYQNGVPVQARDDFEKTSDPRRLLARVALRPGVNRFYAMASRSGSVDGRSQEVEARFDGAELPGQLHVLALGVSTYRRRALRYADVDAQEMAAYLHRRSIELTGKEGLSQVLVNEQVTVKNVENALLALRDRVQGRPQDTVVLFLAGHTTVSGDRFSMLLPTYPFPEGDPGQTSTRGFESIGRIENDGVLPYSIIYSNLARLAALQRLIIIDACRAEAIFSDPVVQSIQRFLATGARGARTAYILATQRGNPAGEAAELGHGLLTYDLLRGMEAPLAGPAADDPPLFRSIPNADFDADGTINAAELRRFAELTLPSLIQRYQPRIPAGDEGGKDARRAKDGPAPLALEIDAEDAVFPVVPLKPHRPGGS
jgi:WD40 repeat protein/uncharacterized caspase-like protein